MAPAGGEGEGKPPRRKVGEGPTDPAPGGEGENLATRRIEHLGPLARADRWGTTIATHSDKDHALIRRFTLQVTSGPDAGQRYVSSAERMVVGTHNSADMVLKDPT